MKLVLSFICFTLAGITISFIPQSTTTYPTYPTVYVIATDIPPTAQPTQTPLPTQAVVQAVIVEDVYQPTSQPEPQEIISVMVVPEIIPTQTQAENYNPSLYDEWKPYVEPVREESVNVLDLDTLWDIAPLVSIGFSACPDPLPVPFVTWDMAQRASNLQSDRQDFEQISIQASIISQIMSEGGGYFPTEGNIRMPENDAIYMLMTSDANVCQINGSITLYGNGVQSFLDGLYQTYLERN